MSIKLLFGLSLGYIMLTLFILFGGNSSNVEGIPVSFDGVLVYKDKLMEKSILLPSQLKDTLELTFLDVGQGDSIYIKTPTGERVLIDGGGNSDIESKLSKKFVFPDCNFEQIFLTHFHLDHYGGLRKITQFCKFNNFTFNDIVCGSEACKYFSSISTKKSNLIGDNYSYKDLNIKVLWPDLKNTNVDYNNPNNLSTVMFIDYGDFEALLTGDAETEALNQIDISQILPYIDNGLDVYKAPHHGAKNGISLSLLQQLKPKFCPISVGAKNKYGHPSKEALDAFESVGCTVLRTDKNGDISFIW